MFEERCLIYTSSGLEVREFLSVPYAKPPVGAMRFKSPQPPEPWTNTLNNSQPSSQCWTSHSTNSWNDEDTGMSEDCLYLSIWSPAVGGEELRSVIVLLTSGKEEGALSGVEMAAMGDVVLVRSVLQLLVYLTLILCQAENFLPPETGSRICVVLQGE